MKKPQAIWCVYLLRCRDGSIYAGITTDMKRRLDEHMRGKGCRYTAGRRPVRLIYRENHPDRSAAARRESHFKGLSRPKKEMLAAGFRLSEGRPSRKEFKRAPKRLRNRHRP
jgi:predicted GIY-YIG superfamily endonuclease